MNALTDNFNTPEFQERLDHAELPAEITTALSHFKRLKTIAENLLSQSKTLNTITKYPVLGNSPFNGKNQEKDSVKFRDKYAPLFIEKYNTLFHKQHELESDIALLNTIKDHIKIITTEDFSEEKNHTLDQFSEINQALLDRLEKDHLYFSEKREVYKPHIHTLNISEKSDISAFETKSKAYSTARLDAITEISSANDEEPLSINDLLDLFHDVLNSDLSTHLELFLIDIEMASLEAAYHNTYQTKITPEYQLALEKKMSELQAQSDFISGHAKLAIIIIDELAHTQQAHTITDTGHLPPLVHGS